MSFPFCSISVRVWKDFLDNKPTGSWLESTIVERSFRVNAQIENHARWLLSNAHSQDVGMPEKEENFALKTLKNTTPFQVFRGKHEERMLSKQFECGLSSYSCHREDLAPRTSPADDDNRRFLGNTTIFRFHIWSVHHQCGTLCLHMCFKKLL